MKKLNMLLLGSLALLATSCDVVIPNITVCSAKTDNIPRDGAFCATSLSGEVWEISATEFLTLLPAVGEDRPGAVVMSAADFNAYKTALDQACRALGKKCKKSVKESIKNLKELSLAED